MKNLSLWAYQNRTKAILITILIHFILWWMYYFAGAFLYMEGVMLPMSLKYLASGIFLIALLFFPIKNAEKGIYKPTLFKKRFWYGMSILSVAIFTVLFGNHRAKILLNTSPAIEYSTQNIALDIKKDSRKLRKEKRKQKRKFRKALRKNIRKAFKRMKKEKDQMHNGVAVLLGLLFIALAVALVYGLLLLSCSIACSGAEILAFFVFFFGLGLVFYGLIKAFRWLKRRMRGEEVKLFEKED